MATRRKRNSGTVMTAPSAAAGTANNNRAPSCQLSRVRQTCCAEVREPGTCGVGLKPCNGDIRHRRRSGLANLAGRQTARAYPHVPADRPLPVTTWTRRRFGSQRRACLVVGVADVLAERGALAAYETNPSHRGALLPLYSSAQRAPLSWPHGPEPAGLRCMYEPNSACEPLALRLQDAQLHPRGQHRVALGQNLTYHVDRCSGSQPASAMPRAICALSSFTRNGEPPGSSTQNRCRSERTHDGQPLSSSTTCPTYWACLVEGRRDRIATAGADCIARCCRRLAASGSATTTASSGFRVASQPRKIPTATSATTTEIVAAPATTALLRLSLPQSSP
jgi:hypothetical protein